MSDLTPIDPREYYANQQPASNEPAGNEPVSPASYGGEAGNAPVDPREYWDTYQPRQERIEQPSYWQRPDNIVQAYNAIQTAPDGYDWTAAGINPDAVTSAYDYLRQLNGTNDWTQWQPLDPTDPFAQALAQLQAPAEGFQWDAPYKPADTALATTQPTTPALPTGGDLSQLTGWQRVMAFTMSNGTLSGVTNALPWMALGAAGGFAAGGPVGAILGAGGALFAGGLLGFASDPETQEQARQALLAKGYSQGFVDTISSVYNGAFAALNKPAEWFEQGLGTGIQLADAAIDPNRTVKDMLDILPEVWEASRLTYEAAATTNIGGAIAEGPAAIEFLWDKLWGNPQDVQFAQDGEVLTLGPEQVRALDTFGLAILNAARNEIKAGQDPQAVIEKWQEMTGFSGQMADMLYQSGADPLNIIPLAERGIVGGAAKLTDNALLGKAARLANDEGLIGTFRTYGELLRSDPAAPDPWRMSKFQLMVSDLDPVTGVPREYTSAATRVKRGALTFAESPLNPMSWWNGLKELTPQSKLSMFTGMSSENLMGWMDQRADFPQMRQELGAIRDGNLHEVKATYEQMGTPEWYAMRQGFQSVGKETDLLFDTYERATPYRQDIARIAEATGLNRADVEQMLVRGDAKKVSAEIAKLLPAGHPMLNDGTLSPSRMGKMKNLFTKNPYALNDGLMRAKLYQTLSNGLEAWAVKSFNVKPEAKIFRANAALKSLQSLVLLDFSPGYLTTNIATDTSTKIFDGVLGFARKETLQWYAEDFLGHAPASIRDSVAGITGDTRQVKQKYASIEEAYRQGGEKAAIEYANAEAMSNAFAAGKAGDAIDKVQSKIPRPGFGMRAVSSAYEEKSRLATHYTATMGAWSRMWQEGRSIPRMPDNLRTALDNINPGLSKLVMAAVKDAKNKGGIARLLTGVERMATGQKVAAYIPDIATKLGIPEAEVQATLSQLGVPEKLDGLLAQGLNVNDAFAVVERDMRSVAQQDRRQRLINRAEQAAATIKAEGLAGVVGVVDDVAWMRDEYHMQHFRDREADAANGWMNYSQEAVDAGWQNVQETERAVWRGLLQQMGLMDKTSVDRLSPDSLRFLGAEKGIADAWRNYFSDVRKEYKTAFEATRNMVEGSEPYKAVYDGVQRRAHELYKTAAARELELTRAKGEAFIRAWREQHGDAQLGPVAYWMRGIYDATKLRSDLMTAFRAKLLGEPTDNPRVNAIPDGLSRGELWTKFLESAYLPAIGELTMRQMDGVNAMADAANNMPARADYSEAMRWFGLDGEQPRPDIDPEVTDVQQRAADTAALQQQVERVQAPPPPDPDRRQSENAFLRETIDKQTAYIKQLEGELDKRSHDDVAYLPLGVVFEKDIIAAPWKIAIDLNGLGWTNKFDHALGGDIMIRAFAETSRELNLNMYRMRNGGDEFVITANSKAEAEEIAKRFSEAYWNKVIPLKAPGEPAKRYTHFDFTYAIGQDHLAADAEATRIKNQWYADHPDFKKGTKPPNIESVDDGAPIYDMTNPTDRREWAKYNGIPDRMLDDALRVEDYRAEIWAQRFGKTVEDYYREVHAKRGTPEDLGGDAQYQEPQPMSRPPVRFEAGKALSKAERQTVLQSIGDSYKDLGAPKTEKGIGQSGEMRTGYEYNPDYMYVSDITGRYIRHYIELPDGRKAHPSELFPDITDAEINRAIAISVGEAKLDSEMNKSRLNRVVAAGTEEQKGQANRRYNERGRKLDGSYLATNEAGDMVRVDGKDAKDVAFFEEQGFRQITKPVSVQGQPSATPGEPRGAWDRVKRMLYAFEKRNADTWVHENAHLYMDNLPDAERARVLAAFNNDPEAFADGYVRWQASATRQSVPTVIQKAFTAFRDFLAGILDQVLGKGKRPGKGITPEQVAEFERMYRLDPWDSVDADPEVIRKALADGYYVRDEVLAAHPDIVSEQAARLANGDPVSVGVVDVVPEGPERVLMVRQIAAEYGVKGDKHITATLRKAEYGGDPTANLHDADPEFVRRVMGTRREVKAQEAAAKGEVITQPEPVIEQPPAPKVPDVVKAVEQGKQFQRTDTRAEAFKRWFGESKVTDDGGQPLVMYHGGQRVDRIAEKGKFDKKRATSGPMSYFTDSPEVASSYAKNKEDTSLFYSATPEDFANMFMVKLPGERSKRNIVQLWYGLDGETQRTLMQRLPYVEEDANGNLVYNPDGGYAPEHFEYVLGTQGRYNRNPIEAAIEAWLEGGSFVGEEHRFIEVLRAAGLGTDKTGFIDFATAPRYGVVPVYLSIQNPLDTRNLPDGFVDTLKREITEKKIRAKRQQYGSDPWDKNMRDPREWVASLEDDIKNGTTQAWTSIPDWVSDVIRRMGYDGIKDVGGKYGGEEHGVWIPLDETQVKSVFNRGTFDPDNPNILYQHPDAPGGVSVQRFLTPQAIGGRNIIGAAYIDGSFVAYIPNRLDTTRRFETDAGISRVLGVDPDGDWVVYNEATGETRTLPANPDETFPVIGPMVPDGLGQSGAVQPDESQLFSDGLNMWGKPILDALHEQMQQGLPIAAPDLSRLSEADKKMLRQYAEQVAGAMSKTKATAVRIGDQRTELALLNYNKRYGIDKYLDLAFPYQFWFSRSMVNWALRFADRPGLLAFFGRLANFTDDDLDEQYNQIPSRMKGKVRIPMPFLNSIAPWAGGAIYTDPWGKIFPFRDFLRPWERYSQTQTRVRRVAEQYIQKAADEGNIDPDTARLAMAYADDPTNPANAGGKAAFEQAMRQAQAQEGGDAVDFLSLVSAPSLLFSLVTRGPEKVGPFPLSRTMQALSAVTGWDGLATLDPEAKLRKGAGLSEFGDWGNYYIDRMLSNMAGDGSFTADEVRQAMMDRSGPVYDEALNRTRQELALREPGMLPLLATRNALQGDGNILDILGAALVGWLPGGLLPEGELELRGLADDYRAAWAARNSGENPKAVSQFFEDHPEYQARLALWDEPEERLRQFMISQVWQKYGELNDIDQDVAARMLGKDFQQLFLNSETRDTDALGVDTLVKWSQALGGIAPKSAPPVEPLQLGGDITATYQAEKDRLFPGIDDVLSRYWGATDDQRAAIRALTPTIDEYWSWEAQYIAANPALIPYAASGNEELAGASPDVQYMVYQYRAEKARLFPGLGALLDRYYQTPSGSDERRTLRQQNPMLTAYWDWEKQFLSQFPEVARYVKSDESAFKVMFGDEYTEKYGQPIDPTKFTPEAQAALNNYFSYRDPLSVGASRYLYYQWEKAGAPFGSFYRWLDSLGIFY